jgi:hypothetical protein
MLRFILSERNATVRTDRSFMFEAFLLHHPGLHHHTTAVSLTAVALTGLGTAASFGTHHTTLHTASFSIVATRWGTAGGRRRCGNNVNAR